MTTCHALQQAALHRELVSGGNHCAGESAGNRDERCVCAGTAAPSRGQGTYTAELSCMLPPFVKGCDPMGPQGFTPSRSKESSVSVPVLSKQATSTCPHRLTLHKRGHVTVM